MQKNLSMYRNVEVIVVTGRVCWRKRSIIAVKIYLFSIFLFPINRFKEKDFRALEKKGQIKSLIQTNPFWITDKRL